MNELIRYRTKPGRPRLEQGPCRAWRFKRSDEGRWTDVTRQKNPEGKVYEVNAPDFKTAKSYAYSLRLRQEGMLSRGPAGPPPSLKTFRVARLESGKWIDADVEDAQDNKVYEVETTSFYLARHKANGMRTYERIRENIGERSL